MAPISVKYNYVQWNLGPQTTPIWNISDLEQNFQDFFVSAVEQTLEFEL